MPPKSATSPSSTPVPSTEGGANDASSLPEAELDAMQNILNFIYDYRTPEYAHCPKHSLVYPAEPIQWP